MTNTYAYERLKLILQELDEEKYPECINVIYYNINTDSDDIYETPFEIACDLCECDQSEVLPKIIADFVIEIFVEEIKKENAAAMTNLGSLYYTGRCGEQSYEKAVKYYTIADEHGDRQATENLGYCYYYGRSVPVDYEKAFNYFVKGALDNHLNSLYKIGDMYKNGYYVKKDEKEAFYIYHHCYNQMTDECTRFIGADICLRMGNVYFYGIGTSKNLELALKYYQEAEQYFYIKIKDGDYFARNGLKSVIEKQNEIRKEIAAELPDFLWTNNN